MAAMKVQGGKMVAVTPQTQQVVERVKREVFNAERELVRSLNSMKSVGRSLNNPEIEKAATRYLEMMNQMQGVIRNLTV